MKHKILTLLIFFLFSSSVSFAFPTLDTQERSSNLQAAIPLAQTVNLPTGYRQWIQLGVRAGAIAPGVGLVVDITALPIGISDQMVLMTRLGYGLVNGNDQGGGVLYLNEVLFYEITDSPMAFYLGGGINKPSKNNSDFGYNIILGITHKTAIFHTGDEALFLETGINNYVVPDFDESMLNVMLGYRRLF